MKNRPEEDVSSCFGGVGGWSYLTDDVLHLLSVEDVGGVDHSGVGGSVHLCVVLVLGLRSRKPPVSARLWLHEANVGCGAPPG